MAIQPSSFSQGRHQGLTARTESGGPGLMGARSGARDLGKKAMGGREKRERRKKEGKEKRRKEKKEEKEELKKFKSD